VADLPDGVLAEAWIGAFATATVPLSEIAALRGRPGPLSAKVAAHKYLKHADEQTVAGISALFLAVRDAGWQESSFLDWAAVGVPRFLGRMNIAHTVGQYLQDPSWSVSPNIIPNQSLHSPSGTVSLALGLHGPNFGAGGGPNAVPEGLVAALSTLRTSGVPGVWMVLTQFEPEPTPDANGVATNAISCIAAALALVPNAPARGTLKLSSRPSTANESGSLRGLIEYLRSPANQPAWQSPVPGLGTLELSIT
jgi:hypothetical protein